VGDLNAAMLVLAVGKVYMLAEAGDVGIQPDSRVLGCDTAVGLNGSGLDHGESRLCVTMLAYTAPNVCFFYEPFNLHHAE
jgi:hypothetical protein